MMALNIAVPMSGVGDLLEGFGLLSPISPVGIDFRSSLKNPLSPVGSESSGVSSLDLEDIKKQMPTLMDENEEDGSSSGAEKSSSNSASLSAASTMSTTSSRTCSTSSSSSGTDDYTNQLDENEQKASECSPSNEENGTATPSEVLGSSKKELAIEPVVTGIDEIAALPPLELLNLSNEPNELPLFSPKTSKKPILPRLSSFYNNRDILDLGSNIRSQGNNGPVVFAFQFAELPGTNNIQFFLQNRSQYHRLGPNGHVQEFRMETCVCCDFQYPVNTVGANAIAGGSTANQSCGTSNLANLSANQIYGNLQQQQQQQQHQQQMRLQQQQMQMQYAYRYNNNGNGNSMGRDYTMYNQQTAGGIGVSSGGGGNAAGGLQSSRFNNGVYGSANVLSGGTLPNTQNVASGGFFNNNLLQGRDQFNPMASGMGMQYNSNGANPKGISQSNGTLSQPAGQQLRQQQQYDMFQQQKQYVNNYSLCSSAAGNNSVNVAASSNAAAVRLQQQQQQQSQQASHYYKKPQTMRYGGAGPAGVNSTLPSGGPTGSNWKSPMINNNTIQDPATKLFMELNKMQQQQQSPYYVPFQ